MGQAEQTFWNLTPALTEIYNRASDEKHRNQQKRDLALAWHIEGLRRCEKLPDLDKILSDIDRSAGQDDFEDVDDDTANELFANVLRGMLANKPEVKSVGS